MEWESSKNMIYIYIYQQSRNRDALEWFTVIFVFYRCYKTSSGCGSGPGSSQQLEAWLQHFTCLAGTFVVTELLVYCQSGGIWWLGMLFLITQRKRILQCGLLATYNFMACNRAEEKSRQKSLLQMCLTWFFCYWEDCMLFLLWF